MVRNSKSEAAGFPTWGLLSTLEDKAEGLEPPLAQGCGDTREDHGEALPVVLSGVAVGVPGSPRVGIQWARRRGADHRSGNWDCVEQGTT